MVLLIVQQKYFKKTKKVHNIAHEKNAHNIAHDITKNNTKKSAHNIAHEKMLIILLMI